MRLKISLSSKLSCCSSWRFASPFVLTRRIQAAFPSWHLDTRICTFHIVDSQDACLATACVTVSLKSESMPLQLKTALITPQLMGGGEGALKRQNKSNKAAGKTGLHNWWQIIKNEGLSLKPSDLDVWSFSCKDEDYLDVNLEKQRKTCQLMATWN